MDCARGEAFPPPVDPARRRGRSEEPDSKQRPKSTQVVDFQLILRGQNKKEPTTKAQRRECAGAWSIERGIRACRFGMNVERGSGNATGPVNSTQVVDFQLKRGKTSDYFGLFRINNRARAARLRLRSELGLGGKKPAQVVDFLHLSSEFGARSAECHPESGPASSNGRWAAWGRLGPLGLKSGTPGEIRVSSIKEQHGWNTVLSANRNHRSLQL